MTSMNWMFMALRLNFISHWRPHPLDFPILDADSLWRVMNSLTSQINLPLPRTHPLFTWLKDNPGILFQGSFRRILFIIMAGCLLSRDTNSAWLYNVLSVDNMRNNSTFISSQGRLTFYKIIKQIVINILYFQYHISKTIGNLQLNKDARNIKFRNPWLFLIIRRSHLSPWGHRSETHQVHIVVDQKPLRFHCMISITHPHNSPLLIQFYGFFNQVQRKCNLTSRWILISSIVLSFLFAPK